MDFSEKWGKDVDEAVRLALIDLDLTEDQVNVIVIEEPTKGFLGLGAKLAKVRVEKKKDIKKEEFIRKEEIQPKITKESEVAIEESPTTIDSDKAENLKILEASRVIKTVKETKEKEEYIKPAKKEESPSHEKDIHYDSKFSLRERPSDLEEVFEGAALEFLKEITIKMGLELEIKAFQNESHLYIEMSGKDSGTIIGKRGQTLDSVQYLTSLVVNKNKENYIRVVVDAENYRSKREQTLEQLANRLADKVVKTGRSVRLEPMNPYERKVIHATLQKNPKVTTKSEGEEPFRRVVIDCK